MGAELGLRSQVGLELDSQRELTNAWRYVAEVQDAGKPADVTGYR